MENDKIIEVPLYSGFVPNPRGVGQVFYDAMYKNRDRLAQIFGPTGETDTYDELLNRCIQTAKAMTKTGIQYGDYVSICTDNHLNTVTPIIASYFVGAIVAAVDEQLNVDDMSYLLAKTIPKIIFCTPKMVCSIEKVLQKIGADAEIVVFGNSTTHKSFSEFLNLGTDTDEFKLVQPKSLSDTVTIYFTSGSTGYPKGVPHNHASTLLQHENMINGGFSTNLYLEYSTPYWTSYSVFMGANVLKGHCRLIYSDFDQGNPWCFLKYSITEAFFAIEEILHMVNVEKPKDADLSALKCVCIGGNVLNEEQIKTIQLLFPNSDIYNMYGQSEIPGPLLTFMPSNVQTAQLKSRKPASVGLGVAGFSYKVVDIDTEETLGPNQEGELRVKCTFPLGGYIDENVSTYWDSNGWVKTGDLTYYDEDKCFYVIGRLSNAIKYRSFRISPEVVEKVILTHPAVQKVIVTGISDIVEGQHPMALVKLKSGYQTTIAKEIEEHVERIMSSPHKLRGGVKFVDYFPKTPSGKINRRALNNMVMRGEI